MFHQLLAVILLLIYFVYRGQNRPIHNDGKVDMSVDYDEQRVSQVLAKDKNKETKETKSDGTDVVDKYFPNKDYAPEDIYRGAKRNKHRRRDEIKSSYAGASRGQIGPSAWNDHFARNNNIIGASQTGTNDDFLPIDESSGDLAIFKSRGRATCGSNQNCDPEDLFDVDKYLPQEVNDDWFEVQKEPISIKNRHLINITKPIGINTIGQSLRNASWDIRGTPANPKIVVSPWLISSIEPDINVKPF